MFQIQLHSGETNSKSVMDKLKAQGQQRLGAGAFGSVWGAEGTDFVTKVTFGNDWGYLRYLEMVQTAPHNPFFPRIHHVDVYMDRDGDTVLVIKMERLDKRWDSWGGAFDEAYEPFREMAREIRQHSYGIESHDWIDDNADLKQALDLIQQAHLSTGCAKDLHGGNFMMRGHQLVITDPLGYPD
jgi:hypothetical protein